MSWWVKAVLAQHLAANRESRIDAAAGSMTKIAFVRLMNGADFARFRSFKSGSHGIDQDSCGG